MHEAYGVYGVKYRPGGVIRNRKEWSLAGDLVLLNGHLVTSDRERPFAQALAIRDGVISVVGTNDEALAERSPSARVIDLGGCTATAAFNDAHCHPMLVGFTASQLDASPEKTPSITSLVSKIKERAASESEGRWILARGYDDARLKERRHPTRADLDAAAPEHPVFLSRACLHIGVANSEALRLAGTTRETPDPADGVIDRDEHGEPTGILREGALELVRRAIPEPTTEEIEEALVLASDLYHAVGVTSVAEAGIRRAEEMEAYQRLREEGRLGLRTYLMMILDEMLDSLAAAGIRSGFGDSRLRIGPVKMFLDGSIGGRTARMREPYEEEADNFGLWMQEPEEILTKLLRAHELGWQCTAHTIGDAAIDLLLDCYEQALMQSPRPNTRHRIEHCEFITDSTTFDRIKRLGCVPVPGTTFLRDFRPLYANNLGPGRLRYANAMRSFAEKGIVAAASSDAPVCTIDLLAGIQTMMTRRDFSGEAAFPEEAISFEEAVFAYTWAGAYASFEENIKGSLTPGKAGDVAVLGADVREVDPEDVSEVGVKMTVMDGEVVHGL